MPEYRVRVHEPPRGAREVLVVAEHAGRVAEALGLPASRVLAVQEAAPHAAGRTSLDLRLFAQELSVLLEAGIPLLEALQTLREKDRGAASLDVVLTALREGRPLSAALMAAPREFDPLFVALVAASERTGQLAATLRQHAAWLAWTQALRQRLVAAAVYPLMLLGVGGAVVMFLLLYVLPRFAGVFEGLGQDVPAASRLLLALGLQAQAYPVVALGLALGVPLAAVAAWRWPAARARAEALAWRSPLAGPRLRVLALARLYRSLALLLGAGVPVTQALRLAEGLLAAPLRPTLATALAAVTAGERLSQALQSQGLATPVALRMLRVGESSGEVPAMFERAAAFHDDEIARLGDLVTRVVNPLLMLVMGAVIGGIVVLMYLPIFTLMEQVQ